jgi:hypothetical protein
VKNIRKNGRDDWIRTSDLTHPKRARYQAALRPDGVKPAPFGDTEGIKHRTEQSSEAINKALK